MTNTKSTKRALLFSIVSLLLCFAMLVGTTFAWFTDSAVSANNVIQSGKLKVGMYWAEGAAAVPTADADWKDATTGAIFDYDKWEPGFVQVRHVKIANEGTLGLKYKVLIEANGEVSKLADVIDVYYFDPAEQIGNRNQLVEAKRLGTLTEVLANLDNTGNGTLLEGKADTITIAFKMQETAGNEYQGLSLGSSFSIKVLATQLTAEEDSFNDQYDKDATYPEVSTPVAIPATGAVDLKTETVSIQVPEEILDEIPAEVKTLALVHSAPQVDATEKTLTFDAVDVVDQDGNVVDFAALNTGAKLTLTLPAEGFADGTVVSISHDGEYVCDATVLNGEITYEVAHLCEITVKAIATAAAKVEYADGKAKYFVDLGDAVAALADGATVVLMDDVALTETLVLDAYVEATLDLGGHKVTGPVPTLIKIAHGKIALKNGSIVNVYPAATTSYYSIYIAGDAVAEIKDVTIETSGTGILVADNARITELNANVDSYMNANGYCMYDAISLIDNAGIDLISGGTYVNRYTDEFIQAWYENRYYSGMVCHTVSVNGDNAYIGEISGGTFLGLMDKAFQGATIHVNSGTIKKISGGYFGFAKNGLTNPEKMVYIGANGSIGSITGGTFEKGSYRTGFGCDLESIVNASGCSLVATGKTVDVAIQFSTRVAIYTLSVLEVVAN